MAELIAIIKIRSSIEKNEKIKNTFDRLRLRKKHVCVLFPKKPEIVGMVNKVKDFVAYGEIDKETLKELIEKRGRLKGNENVKLDKLDKDFIDKLYENKVRLEDVGIKPFFRLHPPRKGFPRKGIKKAFKEGGALGYWGKNINDLIRRML